MLTSFSSFLKCQSWIQIKQNCRNWQKLWHVTLWQWWDDHCEIRPFLATFRSEFISWNQHQNISRFHSSSACYNWWQLPRRAQYDNPSSFLLHSPATLTRADCCLSVCGFLFSLWTFDWELQLTLVTATATSLPRPVSIHYPDTHQSCPHQHYNHRPYLHLSSLHSLKFSKVAWESFGFDIK